MATIVRSADEVEKMMDRAGALSRAAEEHDATDELAEGIYEFCRWLLGESDDSPADGSLEDSEGWLDE